MENGWNLSDSFSTRNGLVYGSTVSIPWSFVLIILNDVCKSTDSWLHSYSTDYRSDRSGKLVTGDLLSSSRLWSFRSHVDTTNQSRNRWYLLHLPTLQIQRSFHSKKRREVRLFFLYTHFPCLYSLINTTFYIPFVNSSRVIICYDGPCLGLTLRSQPPRGTPDVKSSRQPPIDDKKM